MRRLWRFLDSWEFIAGWAFGLWVGVGARAVISLRRQRALAAVATPLPRVALTPDEEADMLEARRQCSAAADALEAALPLAAAALRAGIESQPLSLFVVREQHEGGVLERPVAAASA